jgi:hypothetical protein
MRASIRSLNHEIVIMNVLVAVDRVSKEPSTIALWANDHRVPESRTDSSMGCFRIHYAA